MEVFFLCYGVGVRWMLLLQVYADAEAGIICQAVFAHFLLIGWLVDFPEAVQVGIAGLVVAEFPPGIEIEIITKIGKQADLYLVTADGIPEGPGCRFDKQTSSAQNQLFLIFFCQLFIIGRHIPVEADDLIMIAGAQSGKKQERTAVDNGAIETAQHIERGQIFSGDDSRDLQAVQDPERYGDRGQFKVQARRDMRLVRIAVFGQPSVNMRIVRMAETDTAVKQQGKAGILSRSLRKNKLRNSHQQNQQNPITSHKFKGNKNRRLSVIINK